MLKKRVFTAATAALIAALPANAPAATAKAQAEGGAQAIATMDNFTVAQVQSYLDVIAQLEANGYTLSSVERTLLGRMKITAQNRVHVRELVVSRSTGEVMRDTVVRLLVTEEGAGEGSENVAAGEEDETGAGVGVDIGASVRVDLGGRGEEGDDGFDFGAEIDVDGGISIGN